MAGYIPRVILFLIFCWHELYVPDHIAVDQAARVFFFHFDPVIFQSDDFSHDPEGSLNRDMEHTFPMYSLISSVGIFLILPFFFFRIFPSSSFF